MGIGRNKLAAEDRNLVMSSIDGLTLIIVSTLRDLHIVAHICNVAGEGRNPEFGQSGKAVTTSTLWICEANVHICNSFIEFSAAAAAAAPPPFIDVSMFQL